MFTKVEVVMMSQASNMSSLMTKSLCYKTQHHTTEQKRPLFSQ